MFTVPIYQILHDVKDKIEDLTIDKMLEVIERQAQQGVSYFYNSRWILIRIYATLQKEKWDCFKRWFFNGCLDDALSQRKSIL